MLCVETEAEERREDDNGFDSNFLSLVVLWLGGPVQKSDDVLRQLRRRGRCSWIMESTDGT